MLLIHDRAMLLLTGQPCCGMTQPTHLKKRFSSNLSHQGKEGNSISLDVLEDSLPPATVELTSEDSILNMMHSLLIQPISGGVQP